MYTTWIKKYVENKFAAFVCLSFYLQIFDFVFDVKFLNEVLNLAYLYFYIKMLNVITKN
jgi:hypothetical protein